MSETVTDSRFHMWRTLFALIHADNIVAKEEIRYAAEALTDVPFSEEQRRLLREDLIIPRDPVAMFSGITDKKDQARFFKFASELVWVDGRYVREEQEWMLMLEAEHLRNIELSQLIGHIDLEFEDASERMPTPENLKDLVQSFKKRCFPVTD